jgi:hypothetical protein
MISANPKRSTILLAAVLSCLMSAGYCVADEQVDFQRDIRPLLAANCFQCHGRDADHRQAGLRLDTQEGAHEYAIVPGNAEDSEVVARITSSDQNLVMPPPDSGKSLSEREKQLLRRWIDDGAVYQEHWAFIAPVRPAIPNLENKSWIQNPIDAFVLNRLHENGLSPSPQADRAIWLRRLSLDLIGLPPSIEDVDAFIADQSNDAYEKQINRLLASPHFGERWARVWLDAARYADSDGYEKDKPREMWFYRDWVINAFNRDLPYDQFIIEQIAGDQFPNPTQANIVATGYLRNSMVNEEGGADPEQFRMEAMFDRMDAIGKGVLGLTVQCAQCHSHKYDPLTHDQYYQLFAFLNNTDDAIIQAFTADESVQRQNIIQQVDAIENELKQSSPDWQSQMANWEQAAKASMLDWHVLTPDSLPYDGTKFRKMDDGSIVCESYAPVSMAYEFETETKQTNITAVRMELLTDPQLPRGGPGRSLRGTAAISEFQVFIAPANEPNKKTQLKWAGAYSDVNPIEAPQPQFLWNEKGKEDKRITGPIDFAIDGKDETAWTIDIDPARRNQSRQAIFVADQPFGFEGGTIISFKPIMKHGGWNNNDNHNCLIGRFRFSATSDTDEFRPPIPQKVLDVLAIEPEQRNQSQRDQLFSYWRTTLEQWQDANDKIDALWRGHPEGANQLVLSDRPESRTTSVLARGDFLSPVKTVEPAVPGFLHSLPDGAHHSRLQFANWLVDRKSPTTARSIVNRIWQSYFGIGLVETVEDLGIQSTAASHPQLLDWLAVELMENDWSLKHIHRLITSSATYRQSSQISAQLNDRDPYNRLLARGPRFRVDAEIVRDIALASSGLLNKTIGGPSVHPPAPTFLFNPPASYGHKQWPVDQGPDRYRRGLYTFRFRSVPPPMLETFDAVPGNTACVRRNRSNTPLQSLTLLNGPQAMEYAKALAEQTLNRGGDNDRDKIIYAMRRCIARTPADNEIKTVNAMLQQQRARLKSNQLSAAEILQDETGDGDQSNELAAWTLVSRVLLSLDETITKE